MARAFNGSTDKISVAHNSGILYSNGDVIAASAWVKTNALSSGDHRHIATKLNTAGTLTDYAFRASYVSAIKHVFLFFFTSSGPSNHNWQSDNHVFPSGSYIHVAFSYTFGTGASFSLYIDGASAPGLWTVGTGNSAPVGSTDALLIGKLPHNDAANRGWDGSIAEVLLYKDPGVNAQFLSSVRFKPFRFKNGLVWAGRLGMGSPEPDLSGSGYPGTVTGTTISAHSPTAPPFGFAQPSPYAVVAGVAGPLVNSPSRLTTLVGGGLA